MHPILDKTAHVVVICEQGTIRHQIVGTLRQLGYDHVAPLSSLRDFIRYVRTEPVDWVITMVMADQDATVLNLLQLVIDRRLHKQVKVSLLCGQEEATMLPIGFENGLFSWHERDAARNQLTQSLASVAATLKEHSGDPVLTSAHYLRQHLLRFERTTSLVELEQSLIEHFPGKPDLLVNLARGLLEDGQSEEALTAFSQAVFLDRNLEAKCRQIFKDYQSRHPDFQNKQTNSLGAKAVICIDPDDTALNQQKNFLAELGITNVSFFNDGETAWNWISTHGAPDLILMEWRIPKITGTAFVQKLRSAGHLDTAIILVTSLLGPEDKPLINELSIAGMIAKPIDRQEFLLGLRYTLRQERRPTEQLALERAILRALANKCLPDAKRLNAAYMANKKVSEGRKILMRAQFAYYQDRFNDAKDLVVAAIKTTGTDSLATINLLGKCLLKLGDNRSALRCFERARALSPHNIQRLCDIASLHLEQGDSERAGEVLAAAKEVDPLDGQVLATQMKRALVDGERLDLAKTLMRSVPSKLEIVRFSNNRAVALIREGKFEDALKLYFLTLNAMPTDEHELRSLIQYNLGLAYARQQKLPDSAKHLSLALNKPAEAVRRKTRSLLERVQQAISNECHVILRTGKQGDLDADDIGFETLGGEDFDSEIPLVDLDHLIGEDIEAGQACLYKIFRNRDDIDTFTEQLLAKLSKSRRDFAA